MKKQKPKAGKLATGETAKRLKSFEECYEEINEIIGWNRGKWRLNSLAWMDFQDVSQKIRLHIYKKWNLWDQKKPLRPWISRIVSNQIINMVRNHYTIYARPCVTCPHNTGGNSCDLYGDQCSACPLFAKWETGKKTAHEINNPISINAPFGNFSEQVDESSSSEKSIQIKDENADSSDLEKKVEEFHEVLLKKLNVAQSRVYSLLFIENKTEEEAAKILGFYTKEENRSPGYKQIKNLKKQILTIAKKLAYE